MVGGYQPLGDTDVSTRSCPGRRDIREREESAVSDKKTKPCQKFVAC
jgi:hypothetical protein